MSFPRFLTLQEEERPVRTGSGRLLKQHHGAVTFPDGTNGTFAYERLGPACHRYEYRYNESGHKGGILLPRQYLTRPLGNTPANIEEAGRKFAEKAFAEAIERERREYFRRATPPSGERLDPAAFQFSAKRAQEIGGTYALCLRLGAKLLPVGEKRFPTLAEANTAWQERPEAERTKLVVGCACRWSRRWEKPRFNTLNRLRNEPDLPLTEPCVG